MLRKPFIGLTLLAGSLAHAIDFSHARWQVSLHRTHYETFIAVTDNRDPMILLDREIGHLYGAGFDVSRVFTEYSSVELGGYVIHRCGETDPNYDIRCTLEPVIPGMQATVKVGFNLLGHGLFAYSGARYYFESSPQDNHLGLAFPVGVGLRAWNASVELSTEIRGRSSEQSAPGIYSLDHDPEYTIAHDDDAAVFVTPFRVHIGYQF